MSTCVICWRDSGRAVSAGIGGVAVEHSTEHKPKQEGAGQFLERRGAPLMLRASFVLLATRPSLKVQHGNVDGQFF